MADGGATRKRGTVSRDREILCVLFHATNKAKAGQRAFICLATSEEIREDGWKVKDGWISSQPMAEWHGVTTNVEGRVIGLNLEGNYLAGIIPPQLGELDALEQLHLGSNLLKGGIPKELGKLLALKGLTLSQNWNLGGVIPPQLGDLNALEKVHLGFCKLQGNIPPELGKLHALQTLDLDSNHLDGSIPAELGNLGALKRLDLHGNQLTGSIPAELGNLGALERLNLNFNQLTGCVPPQLGNLQALEEIELSNNQLKGLWDHTQDALLSQGAQGVSGSSIPNQLSRLLELLRKVEERRGYYPFLGSNPWAEPPEAVVNSGIVAVIGYFDALYSSPCRVRRNSVKVVLVGQEGAGKTSLCRSMKTGRATPTDGSAESTVYADLEKMELNGASVRVYDCAGQVAYTGLLQMFLTPRAVCLVVCNAGAFGQQGGGAEDQVEKDIRTLEELRVCDWLRSISYRVPGSDVILVATKCDLASGNAAGIAQRIDAACRTWLASWTDAGREAFLLDDGAWRYAGGKRIRLEGGVCRTSCFVKATPTNVFETVGALFEKLPSLLFGHEETPPGNRTVGLDWECDWREDVAAEPTRSMLDRVMTKNDGSGLRGAEMVLPPSWDIALTVLEALEDGRDSVEAVGHRSPKTDRGVASTTEPVKGITVEELKVKWKAAVDQLSTKGITVMNPDHALEGALSIREFDGTVVRLETYVFLDVVWLTIILKPLLNHKATTRFDGSVRLGDKGDTRITLRDARHINSWNRLREEGILEPELARVLWPDLSAYVLPLLASLGLAFPLECDRAEGVVVLLRLGTDRPPSVGQDIDLFRVNRSAVFDVCWEFPLGVPPGAVEKILTRCCSIGAVRTFWRFGVLVRGTLDGSEGSGSFTLVLEYSRETKQLDMKAYGDIRTVAPWAAIAYAISTVRTSLLRFPGLRSQAYLKCPEVEHDGRMSIMTDGQGKELLQDGRCSRCSRETGGMGAAAVELVQMVDVQEVRGEVFRELNARFISAQRHYDALRPAVSRDNSGTPHANVEELSREVRKLGPRMSGVEAGMHGLTAGTERLVSDVTVGTEKLHAKMSGVEAGMHGLTAGKERLEAEVGRLAANMPGIMTGMKDAAETRGEIKTMLMAAQGDKVETPRQACILPGHYAQEGLTDSMRDPLVWKTKLAEFVQGDFEVEKTNFTKNLRLFLVCARTEQLVPCGHDGRGYEVRIIRERARVAFTVAKAVVEVASATLAAVFAAQAPGAIIDAAATVALGGAAGVAQLKLDKTIADSENRAEKIPSQEVNVLEGAAYENLKSFVLEVERMELANARKKAKKGEENSFVFFKDVMEKVQTKTGYHWELKP